VRVPGLRRWSWPRKQTSPKALSAPTSRRDENRVSRLCESWSRPLVSIWTSCSFRHRRRRQEDEWSRATGAGCLAPSAPRVLPTCGYLAVLRAATTGLIATSTCLWMSRQTSACLHSEGCAANGQHELGVRNRTLLFSAPRVHRGRGSAQPTTREPSTIAILPPVSS
jgi:hypothetical protein